MYSQRRFCIKQIENLSDYCDALHERIDALSACGCRFADHALDDGFVFYEDDGQNEARFQKVLMGESVSGELVSYLLCFLGKEYEKRQFVMQLHIGAQRFTSSRLRNAVGPAGGFAGIGNAVSVYSLTRFLDALEKQNGLPKTVLFSMNPSDYATLSVLSGSYSKDGVAGLITQGPAWWWCDHVMGIRDVLEHTASYGLLTNFIGMTTDSRSPLSFVRHDYFRQILCEYVGTKAENGEYPKDEKLLKEMLYAICYGNAAKCFE